MISTTSCLEHLWVNLLRLLPSVTKTSSFPMKNSKQCYNCTSNLWAVLDKMNRILGATSYSFWQLTSKWNCLNYMRSYRVAANSMPKLMGIEIFGLSRHLTMHGESAFIVPTNSMIFIRKEKSLSPRLFKNILRGPFWFIKGNLMCGSGC